MNAQRELHLVVVSAGASDPSSTRMLADRLAERTAALAYRCGAAVTTSVIDLRELATDIASALVSQLVSPKLRDAFGLLGNADGIIAAAPVYKAGPSGLFTSFFQLLDDDLLIARPVLLAATAGTDRHALVVDEQMRSLFAYLRATSVPTSLFAAPDDWGDPALGKRIDRAALELVVLMNSGFAATIREQSWESYSHQFGSAARASDAGDAAENINLDTDLMRLATGGSVTSPAEMHE